MARITSMTMQIDHPQSHALTEEETAVLQSFKQRLVRMVSNHGITSANIQEMLQELKAHPSISVQLMQEIHDEVGRLLPGQRFTFDWD